MLTGYRRIIWKCLWPFSVSNLPQVIQHGERGRRCLKRFSGGLEGASVGHVGGSMVGDVRGAGV